MYKIKCGPRRSLARRSPRNGWGGHQKLAGYRFAGLGPAFGVEPSGAEAAGLGTGATDGTTRHRHERQEQGDSDTRHRHDSQAA